MTPKTNVNMVVIGLLAAMFIGAMDVTVVATATPNMTADLEGEGLFSWVFAVYTLAACVATPIFGKLADLFGRKGVLAAGISLFVLGSILCGASRSMEELIGFRALQGLGAGALTPVCYTIIGDLFSEEKRGKIMGLFTSVWSVAGLLGPLVGGYFVDQASWRWIFYLNVPIGAAALLLVVVFLRQPAERRSKRIDYLGDLYPIHLRAPVLAADRRSQPSLGFPTDCGVVRGGGGVVPIVPLDRKAGGGADDAAVHFPNPRVERDECQRLSGVQHHDGPDDILADLDSIRARPFRDKFGADRHADVAGLASRRQHRRQAHVPDRGEGVDRVRFRSDGGRLHLACRASHELSLLLLDRYPRRHRVRDGFRRDAFHRCRAIRRRPGTTRRRQRFQHAAALNGPNDRHRSVRYPIQPACDNARLQIGASRRNACRFSTHVRHCDREPARRAVLAETSRGDGGAKVGMTGTLLNAVVYLLYLYDIINDS